MKGQTVQEERITFYNDKIKNIYYIKLTVLLCSLDWNTTNSIMMITIMAVKKQVTTKEGEVNIPGCNQSC